MLIQYILLTYVMKKVFCMSFHYRKLPTTAICVVLGLHVLSTWQLIPNGMTLLTLIREHFAQELYLFAFVIIFLEAIIYVGFYLPGQFLAVLLVLAAEPSLSALLSLTLVMVIAASAASLVNFFLGQQAYNKMPTELEMQPKIKIKQLLLAMIHINSLAFFIYTQASKGASWRICAYAAWLNLPYYFMLIVLTMTLENQVMSLAENSVLLMVVLSGWWLVAYYFDRQKSDTQC